MESHGEDLRKLIQNEELIRHLKQNHHLAQLSPRERVLCEIAEKLTLTPWEMNPTDLALLKNEGLSDTDILDAIQVISFFNYMNRLTDALGCDPEPWMESRKSGNPDHD